MNESALDEPTKTVKHLEFVDRVDYHGDIVDVTATSEPNLFHIKGDGIDSYVSGEALFLEEDIRLHMIETRISKVKEIRMMNVTHRVKVFLHAWKPEFINGYCGNHIDLDELLRQWDIDRESDQRCNRQDGAAHVSQDPRGMWYLLNGA